ncbi:hypothetical protein [Saliphagus sp. LR7]|uniref:hypothetical protein n=1 Tax=Saliphagus sp. LR7 TaxID=2282654 RepID=UPI000DF7305A|nr:hypothetical protein [Saliphagus sp. LR7]
MDGSDDAESGVATRPDDAGVGRRAAIAALGLGGLGLLSGRAGAQSRGRGNQPWYGWESDVDAGGNDLTDLGALELAATGEAVSDLAGENLAVEDGVLHATGGSGAGDAVDVVDIDDYGADPTGEDPSDDALDAAIEDLSEGATLVMTDGEYWFDAPHEIYEDHVTVLGTGSHLRITGIAYGSYSHFLSFGSFENVSDFGGDTVLAADASEGDQRIEVEDPSPFEAGDDVTVSETKYDNTPTLSWGGTAGRGTCPTRAVIREIEGSTLYLDRGLNYDHGAGDAGVFLLDSVVGGRFVDLHMVSGDGEDESEGFLMCAYARECAMIDCSAAEYVGFPFTDIHSLRTVMVDCEATDPVLPERASSHWEPFQFRGSTDPTVIRPSIDTCRRGIDVNAGANTVRVFDPRIRNAYLHGACFHSNADQQVYGAYEIYGGRIEGAEEILHDKYHAGYGLSLSPNQSHVKAFGTTVVGRPAAVNTPYGQASDLTLEGCSLETFAGTSANVVNGTLRNSRLENVNLVGRGSDEIGLNLEGAENVSVSGEIAGDFSEAAASIEGAENVSLDIDVLENATDAPDVAVDDSENVGVTGTLHGSGPSVVASDVSDLRVTDADCVADAGAPIAHAGDGTVSNVWITGCNTAGGDEADIDFDGDDVSGLWIKNNVCGEILADESEGTFVRDNLTGQS